MITCAFTKKEKNVEIKPIFESLYLGNPWCDLIKIWNVKYQLRRASPQQKSFDFVRAAQSYICVKISYILKVWRALASYTLPCILIPIVDVTFFAKRVK